ncbi:MAG: PASTA domain-containing protein [Clostridium sp.]|nr:PASTA domain-containing protein [Clostridium sp.]
MQVRCMGCMEEYDEEYGVCPNCGFVLGEIANEAYHLQPETILQERYIVGKVIGFGGFGITYIGWDYLLQKKIAIKEYFPSEFATRMPEQKGLTIYDGEREEQFDSGKAKFVEEAKRLALFQKSEGIVNVYDSFEENSTAYIVMEYLEGESLKEKLKREGKLSVDETIKLLKPILLALEEVHGEGVLHRDIAPDNIFITNEGTVKLLDFGAARFATTTHSKSLSVILKTGYSPVEQYRSRGEQGPWTDVYATAATFYKCITGITVADAMDRSLNDKLKEPSKLGVKISSSMENAIMNALNVEFDKRTQSAKKFYDDLEAEEVKRIKIKQRKFDTGKIPAWVKATAGVAISAAVTFVLLLVTGVIHFNMKQAGDSVIPEGKTRVPNLINTNVEKAEETCISQAVIIQILGKTHSDEMDADLVLAQTEYGGVIVDEKFTLGVVISAGAEEVFVPDVIGFKRESAEYAIDMAKLDIDVTEEKSIYAPDTVISQNPVGGEKVQAGDIVNLVISIGMDYDASFQTTVPDFLGQSFENAVALAADNKVYAYKVSGEYSLEVPAGTVISQTIEPGLTVSQGTEIGVVVSLGKETVHVPDVQYMNVAQAKAVIEELNLVISIEYEESDTVAKNNVIRQEIAADTEVDAGTVITVYVSLGNDNADNTLTMADAVVTTQTQAAYEQTAVPQPIATTETAATSPSQNQSTNVHTEATTEVVKPNVDTIIVAKDIAVPNVVNSSRESAESTLSSAGLVVYVEYAHKEGAADGTVLSQSISGGSVVKPGSSITISVCNNAKKTQYSSRTITNETTTSSDPALSGWEQTGSTYVWGNYGGWSEWSSTSVSATEARNVETKTQYKNTTSSTSSALGGWTQYGNPTYNYRWDKKTSNSDPGSGSNIRNKSAATTYYYFHYENYYTNESGLGVDSVKSGGTIKSNYKYCEYTTNTALGTVSFRDVGGKQAYGNHLCRTNGFNYWYLKGTSTTYTYEEQVVDSTTYYYYQWADTKTNATETRVLYRYRDRDKIYTYNYKRTVYGEWSAWTDTPIIADAKTDVRTQEVYIY